MLPDPRSLICYGLAALLVASMGTACVERSGKLKARAEVATAKKDLADYRAAAAETGRLAEKAERAEEQRRTANTRKAIDEANLQAQAARADAAIASAAAGKLRDQLAAYIAAVRRAGAGAATTDRGPSLTSSAALDLLADMYSRSDQGAGEIGEFADALYRAGQTCERIADGLQPPAR